MDILLQHLTNGFMLGCIYALAAIAYTMVYGIIELINFAFGELFTFGAFFAVTLMVREIRLFGYTVPMPGLPFWLALPVAMLLVGGLGFVIEKVAYRPLRRAPRLAPLITAIAVSVSLQSLAQSIWGAEELPFPAFALLDAPPIVFGGTRLSVVQLFVVVASLATMAALHAYVMRTRMGRAMRALAQDLNTAALMGIPVDRVIARTFVLGSALAALAGVLDAVSYRFAHPLMGFVPGLKALIAAVLGGIGNIPGAMLGGVTLGLVETLGAAYIPEGSAYRDAIAFGILILLLLFRPQGLLGARVPGGLMERGGLRIVSVPSRIDVCLTAVQRLLSSRPVSRRLLWGAGLLVAVGFFLVFPSDYWRRVFVFVLIYGILASGLNVVVGFAGLLDLGYVAFYAVGAYLSSILFIHVFQLKFGIHPGQIWWLLYVNLLGGGVLAAIFGIVLGYPTLRLRGDYLAIMTLGFGEIVRIVALNWVELTRGPMGIRGIPPPALFGVSLDRPLALYYFALVLLVFTVFTISGLVRSYVGRAWVAVREDETVAETMGVPTARYKLYAYAVGAFYGGVAGVFFAHFQQYVSPFSFILWENILILCLIVLGGMGTLGGPILGAAIWVVFVEWAMEFGFVQAHPETRFLALGVLLWLMMIFRPQGLWGAGRPRLEMS